MEYQILARDTNGALGYKGSHDLGLESLTSSLLVMPTLSNLLLVLIPTTDRLLAQL